MGVPRGSGYPHSLYLKFLGILSKSSNKSAILNAEIVFSWIINLKLLNLKCIENKSFNEK
jgi:hypothetical protein